MFIKLSVIRVLAAAFFFGLQEAYHHCLLPHQRSEPSNANTHNAAVVVKLLNHQILLTLEKYPIR